MRFWQEGKDFIAFGIKAYGMGARLSLDGFDSRYLNMPSDFPWRTIS